MTTNIFRISFGNFFSEICTFKILVWDYTTGRVGAPLVCCEIKLMNWEEGESFCMCLKYSMFARTLYSWFSIGLCSVIVIGRLLHGFLNFKCYFYL